MTWCRVSYTEPALMKPMRASAAPVTRSRSSASRAGTTRGNRSSVMRTSAPWEWGGTITHWAGSNARGSRAAAAPGTSAQSPVATRPPPSAMNVVSSTPAYREVRRESVSAWPIQSLSSCGVAGSRKGMCRCL